MLDAFCKYFWHLEATIGSFCINFQTRLFRSGVVFESQGEVQPFVIGFRSLFAFLPFPLPLRLELAIFYRIELQGIGRKVRKKIHLPSMNDSTTLQSKRNVKVSRQRFWYCHEKRLIKIIPIIPHNLYLSLRPTCFPLIWSELRLILVYPNAQ